MIANEEELIGAAQRGDVQAYNQLVLEYQGLAYNVAYHVLGDADASADAVQDSLLKAYRALGRFHGGSFRAWLLTILTNTCYDQLRTRRRRPQHSIDEAETGAEWSAWLVDRGERPQEYVERQELRRTIQRGMSRLPDDQRTVIVLCDVEGLSYAEIAQVTGMNMGTVKSRLSRARAHLRDYLLTLPDALPREWRQLALAV